MMQEQVEMVFEATQACVSKATYFMYEGRLHVRAIPAKKLFNSAMVYEVVNRGDIFAVCMETGTLTILRGTLTPQFVEVIVLISPKK